MNNSATGRIRGIDLARGVALVGMFVVHSFEPFDINGTPTWQWTVFTGRSAGLFAVLAGLSLTLAARRYGLRSTGAQTNDEPFRSRLGRSTKAQLARVGIIGLLGLLVAVLNNVSDIPVYVILVYYAAAFLIATPLLALSSKWLWIAAGTLAVVGPVIIWALHPLVGPGIDLSPDLFNIFLEPAAVAATVLVTGIYPVITLLALVTFGMALGRLDLTSVAVARRFVVAGVAVATISWVVATAVAERIGLAERLLTLYEDTEAPYLLDQFVMWYPTGLNGPWWLLLQRAPHSNTTFDLLQVGGSAVAVLGLCLLFSRIRISVILAPLYAVGSMPLSAYCAHILWLSIAGFVLSDGVLLVSMLVTILGVSWLLASQGQRGPCEFVVTKAARAAGRPPREADPQREA